MCPRPPLFGIFFAMFLKHAFGTSGEEIYLHTRSDCGLFNLARLRAKTKYAKHLSVFADDAPVATLTQCKLQSLMHYFSQACRDFGLTISPKKINVLGQGTESPPVIAIDQYELEAVYYLAPLSLTTSPWTQSLIRESGRQPQPLRASQHVCGPTPSWQRSEDQDGCVQCLCHPHTTAIRQRDMDHVRQTRKAPELLPHEKPPPYPGNIVARQGAQH